MKSVKYTALILLCCFLLIGCTGIDLSSSSSETNREYSETETETETKDTKQKEKTNKKSKSKKSNKKNSSNKETEPEKITGEYSTDSDVVEEAKNAVFYAFYNKYNCTEEVTYGEVLNYYFDYTQWLDVKTDDFEGVEFIGTKYEASDTWEIHLYYSFDGGFFDKWLGGVWLEIFETYKNGKRKRSYENEYNASDLMLNFYLQYYADHELE